MTVWLHEERSSVTPYGAADQRTMFTPDRIAIEKLDGTIVAERRAPRDSFAGHQMHTPWDPLHRAYFNGYALWALNDAEEILQSDLALDRARAKIFYRPPRGSGMARVRQSENGLFPLFISPQWWTGICNSAARSCRTFLENSSSRRSKAASSLCTASRKRSRGVIAN